MNDTSPEKATSQDYFLKKTGSALSMTCPDGQCWLIKVDNAGLLTTQEIECPGE